MAGVKGKSGGPRPNSGGARAGAGRKPNPKPEIPAVENQQPLDFLLSVQNNPEAPLKDRIRAAVAAAQYVHTKRSDGGKKEERAERAKSVAGRFSAASPPKLAAVGGKKV